MGTPSSISSPFTLASKVTTAWLASCTVIPATCSDCSRRSPEPSQPSCGLALLSALGR
jgi:hypothetical protein